MGAVGAARGPTQSVWDAGTLGALAGVIVVGTAMAFGLYLQGVSMIGPLKGSIMGSVEPVSAVVISVFWLGHSGLRCLIFWDLP